MDATSPSDAHGSGEQGYCFSFRCRCLMEVENMDAVSPSDVDILWKSGEQVVGAKVVYQKQVQQLCWR